MKYIIVSCVFLGIESSRLLSRDLDNWIECKSLPCEDEIYSFGDQLDTPVIRGYACRGSMWATMYKLEAKIDRFLEMLNGGPFGVAPKRPLLLHLEKQVCVHKDITMPLASLSHSMTNSLHCLMLKFNAPAKAVCGCFSKKLELASRADVLGLPKTMREGCDFHVVEPIPLQETIAHYPKPVLGHRSAPAMWQCPAAASQLWLGGTLCAITWNVGSELDSMGIGMGGLMNEELSSALTHLVKQECAGASIVAVSLQEGADREVTTYLHDIAAELSGMSSEGEMRLWANTFAGLKPWGNSKPIKGLNGLEEHTTFKIKEGNLEKYGQILGRPHLRRVVLTEESLLTFQVVDDVSIRGTPIGSPTNALTLERGIEIKVESHICFTTTGYEGDTKKAISFKMCAESAEEATSWILAIRKAADAAKAHTKHATGTSDASVQHLVELPWAKGVSMAVMSIGVPSKVNIYSVDFDCATEDGHCKERTVSTWMKQKARGMTFTTAEKGGAIVRLELGGKAFCFAACHLEAKKREKRWLQSKLMSDALAKLECDAQIWMGDFNTRPTESDGSHKCCPWSQVELYTVRNSVDKLRQLTLNHDDLPLMPGLTAADTIYEEMEVKFPPTFHKRLNRNSMNQCSKFPEKQSEEIYADLVVTGMLANESRAESNANDIVAALITANGDALTQERCHAGKSNMCYGGLETKDNCETGGCFNTHDKDHCPGYTDRILYVAGKHDKNGPILKPCNYVASPSFVGADHTPVVATFALDGVSVS